MAVTISASVGDCGAIKPVPKDVLAVQTLLNQTLPGQGGADPRLVVDGKIGPNTNRAILAFQQHHNLGDSGCIEPGSMLLDKLNTVASGGLDSPTLKKYRFTFESEIGFGSNDSTEPHWPGGESGVTIGPGYDMQFRSAAHIVADLTAVGVDEGLAKKLSGATGLKGDAAKKWIADHAKDGLQISRKQEQDLFELVLVPKYEREAEDFVDNKLEKDPDGEPGKKFGKGTWATLDSDQQAMLFDYQYNPGLSMFPKFTRAVVTGAWTTAQQEFERKGVGQRNDRFEERFLKSRL
jgi:peptidoglycan hydrolase-like protein with peptidoglycan-binding domain